MKPVFTVECTFNNVTRFLAHGTMGRQLNYLDARNFERLTSEDSPYLWKRLSAAQKAAKRANRSMKTSMWHVSPFLLVRPPKITEDML